MSSHKIESLLHPVIADWIRHNTYSTKKLKGLLKIVKNYAKDRGVHDNETINIQTIPAIVTRVMILESKRLHPRISTKDIQETLSDVGINITVRSVRRIVKQLRDSGQIHKDDEAAEKEQRKELALEIKSQIEHDVGKPEVMYKKIQTYTKNVALKVQKRLNNETLYVSVDDVRAALNVVYWNAQRTRIIVDYIKSGKPFEHFVETPGSGTNEVPEWVLEDKWNEYKGRTEGVWGAPHSDRGVWNITSALEDGTECSIPESSPENPLVLEDKIKGDIHRVGTLIAPHFGILYDTDIVNNLVRQSLTDLHRRGVETIILAGRLFYIETTVAGGINKIGRDLYSGITVDISAFAEKYQMRVKEIFEGIHTDELIFMTTEERFEHLLSGLWSISVQPKGGLEFPGNIYVVLGPDEERLAQIIAQAHQRYVVRVLIPKIKSEIRALIAQRKQSDFKIMHLKQKLSSAKLNGEKADVLKYLKKELKFAQENQPAQEDMERLRDLEKRTTLSNVHPIHAREAVPRILSWMAQRIEKAIPNSRVVGMGPTYLKWKETDRTMQVYVDDSKRPYRSFMNGHGVYERQFGLEDVVLTVNSLSVSATTLAVESIRGEVRKTALVCEPPILVDQKAILENSGGVKKASEKIISVVKSPAFIGGMQVFEYHKAVGMNSMSRVPPSFYTVTADHVRKASDEKRKNGSYRLYNQSHISMLGLTDAHFTSMNSYFMPSSEGLILNVFEGFMELVRKHKMKFDYLDVCDDWGQYLNFAGYTNLHPKRETFTEMGEGVLSFLQGLELELKKDRTNKKALMNAAHDFAAWFQLQLAVRGEHTVTEQLEKIYDVIEGYSDIIKEILIRAKETGLNVEGRPSIIDEHTRNLQLVGGLRKKLPVDRRNLGLINHGASNHFSNTFDRKRPGLLFDSEIIRKNMIALFTKDPQITSAGYDAEKLRATITAPRAEALSYGIGTIRINDKDVCPIEMRPSPIKRGAWWDPLSAQIKVDAQRADPPGFFTDSRQYRMFRTGDKHMGQVIVSGVGFYVMGLPATLPDTFADVAGGIRPNSNGVTLNYVAEGGLNSGPTRTIFVPSYTIAYYLKHIDEEFPLLKMLPQLL
jgi:hypothetical protein